MYVMVAQSLYSNTDCLGLYASPCASTSCAIVTCGMWNSWYKLARKTTRLSYRCRSGGLEANSLNPCVSGVCSATT